MSVARGMVMALTLDAVDPRLSGDQRAVALTEAVTLNPELSAAIWTGLLTMVLDGIREANGSSRLDRVMRSLGSAMVAMVDPLPGDDTA